MKNMLHQVKSHTKKHHKKYIGGFFAGFAVVKTFVLLAGVFGLSLFGSSFAAGNELNSTNIVSTYGCATSATTCNFYNRNITSIASDTFVNHNSLITLNLQANPISSIESGDFSGLPNLMYLNLYYNNISSIESGDFSGLPNLTQLRLDHNRISSIESGDFSGLPNLTLLDLGYNQITSIKSGDFSELSTLNLLNLGYNQITSIESGDFSGPSNLNTLDLNQNQISSIESGDFFGPSNLNTLDLNQNQISSIESGDFFGLSSLTLLGLGQNQISSIESGDFSGLPNLNTIDLGQNQITSIESGDFQGLSNLTELSLGQNQIIFVDTQAFQGLSNLTSLYLYSNQISFIDSGTFQGLSNLTELILSSNNISSIESNNFQGLSSVEAIDLGQNQISSIDTEDFQGLSNLTYLGLSSNCLNNEDSYLTSYLDTLTGVNYSSQYACVKINYTPDTITNGAVTGSLYFTGPTSYVAALQANNPDLSSYAYVFTSNESHLFDFSSMIDNSDHLWTRAMGSSNTITGVVSWIDTNTNQCGNEIVENGEVCDNGSNNGLTGYCNLSCTGSIPLPTIPSANNLGLEGIPYIGELLTGTYTYVPNDGWKNVGTAGFSSGTANYTSLAIDNGTPYVAYQDQSNNNKATVMKFNGSAWVAVGSSTGFSSGQANYTSLAIDNGTPYVAYGDSTNSYKATVMKFNGSSWEFVGTPGFSTGQANYTSLIIDNGTLYVAYSDGANSSKATVKKFNGSSWEFVGTPGFSSGGANYTSLIIANNGTPYVAYQDVLNGHKTTVMKFNGINRESVGSRGFSSNAIQFISLAIDNNIPYITYRDDSNGKTTSMKFNGSSWEFVGTPGFSYRANNISSLFNNGNLYIAYGNGANSSKATVMKFIPPNPEGISTYQWYRNNVAITGATHQTYTTTIDDEGQRLIFGVTPVAQLGGIGSGMQSREMTINPTLDLSLDGNYSSGTFIPGDTIHFNIPYTNTGYSAANNIFLIATLSSGLQITSSGYKNTYLSGSLFVSGDRCYDDFLNETGPYYDMLMPNLYNNYGKTSINDLLVNNGYDTVDFDQQVEHLSSDMCLNNRGYISLRQCMENEFFAVDRGNFPQCGAPKKMAITGDICLDQFLDETGAYYEAVDNYTTNYTDPLPIFLESYGYDSGDIGSYGEDIIDLCSNQRGNPDIESCFMSSFGVDFATISTNHPECGANVPASILRQPDTIGAGETKTLSFTAQVKNGMTSGMIENIFQIFQTYDRNTVNNIFSLSLPISAAPVVPVTPPTGGAGGGTILHPDACSPQRDCSSSYYDNLCGPCTSTGTTTTRGSASCDVSTSPYSPEITSAFSYAYDLGITTQCPITKANLTDKVIRSHFAKMITEFAIKVFKKQPNTKITCAFADTANESAELKFYMKTACQLGLMGRNSDGKTTQKNFNPKDTMTRAQLGTVLSRLLYGNVNNSTDSVKWFSKHLQALKTSGIMNDISKPYAEEIRGFILLMLQRASK